MLMVQWKICFETKQKKPSKRNTKIAIGPEKLWNNSENIWNSNNYNQPLNSVCNVKIKKITEIGNLK